MEYGYTDELWDQAADVVNAHLRENTSPESLNNALQQIQIELGELHMQDIEGILDLYGWPMTIMALPHHCVPNNHMARRPQDITHEAPFWAFTIMFHPELINRYQVCEQVMGCSYQENLENLKQTGTAFPSPGRINSFSWN